MRRILLVALAALVALPAAARLPDTPTFHLRAPTTGGPYAPVREFKLWCAVGLNVVGNLTMAPIATVTLGTASLNIDYELPVRTLVDGDWTCYFDVVTNETTARWAPTNRVSFTVRAPALPIPRYTQTVD